MVTRLSERASFCNRTHPIDELDKAFKDFMKPDQSNRAGIGNKWIPRVLNVNLALIRLMRITAWPFLDLGMRLLLAQSFFVSGVLKVTHWPVALQLATTEYPVPWMDPATAAITGVSIELLGSVLLAFGLLTRYVAVPLFILSTVVQIYYQHYDQQLFFAALFGWYAIQGAGPLSLDRLLAKGLGDSALPLAPRLIRASSWVRENLTPWYIFGLRVWLAASLLQLALPKQLAMWMPTGTCSQLAAPATYVGGTLIALGLAGRYASIALGAVILAGTMMGANASNNIYLLATLAILVVHGTGKLSLDHWFVARLKARFPQIDGVAAFDLSSVPRVVIVGAGFGGLSCAAALRDTRAAVTLIDRANYHLFQPLLYQVATAAIVPSDIAVPVRSLFRDSVNTTVLLEDVTGIDTQEKCVIFRDQRLHYDYLVLATGATHSYFGNEQWAAFAPGLKRVEDATAIRTKLLSAFERAESTNDPHERLALLTFLVVGGGPTGVELAGAIAELSRFGMAKEFKHFDPASARVVLIQSAPRILPTFDERLSMVALDSLKKLGVTILTGHKVESIDEQGVIVNGERVASRTVLWAAGVKASPAAAWLRCPADNAGRVKVNSELMVDGLPGVYAIGDTAASDAWNGNPVPGLAPAAKQGGIYVAEAIRSAIETRPAPRPFNYRHFGSLATIGRQAAVADFGFARLWGAPAWWLWGLIHIGFLVGIRNRASTMLNWFWAYLTVGNGIKLIMGYDAGAQPVKPSGQSLGISSSMVGINSDTVG
jgi:putative oxidoreductase